MSYLSVIIPVYNEEIDIKACLESLQKQSFKDFEIIVVDDGSTDNTKEIVKSFKKVRFFTQNHKGPGAARNLGAKHSNGEILVFVDADMTFEKNYLENLVAPLLEDNFSIGATHDNEIVMNTSNIWSRCWGKIRVSPKNANEVKIFRAIRKNKFFEFGGFDPKYGYADDQTFWFKFKVKPIVAKNTICYHKNPETLKQVYKQSRWIGASISNPVLETPFIRKVAPIMLLIFLPIGVPVFSFLKCLKLKKISIFFHMLVFMSVRYAGTVEGIMRKVYFDINYR